MILTIIFIIMVVVGIIIVELYDKKLQYSDIGMTIGCVSALFGAFFLICATIFIIKAHVGIKNDIEINNLKYESLRKRIELVNSEYEDVSKSDVIKDVAEWNVMVQKEKYWQANPWTSWFHSKEVVDNLEMISIDG